MVKNKANIIIVTLLLAPLLILTLFAGCSLDNANDSVYYESTKYKNSTGYEKLVEIVKHEGNEGKNNHYSYIWTHSPISMITYDGSTININSMSTKNNIKLTLMFEINKTNSNNLLKIIAANTNTDYIGSGNTHINTSTFKRTTNITLTEWDGSYNNKSTIESITVELMDEMLLSINNYFNKYNFSVKDLGFINYE